MNGKAQFQSINPKVTVILLFSAVHHSSAAQSTIANLPIEVSYLFPSVLIYVDGLIGPICSY